MYCPKFSPLMPGGNKFDILLWVFHSNMSNLISSQLLVTMLIIKNEFMFNDQSHRLQSRVQSSKNGSSNNRKAKFCLSCDW